MVSDARYAAVVADTLQGGYPLVVKSNEAGFVEAAFRGIPHMKDGEAVRKVTEMNDDVAPLVTVWCHRAQAMLTTIEARARYLPNGAASLSTACGICTCCLN